MIGKLLTIPESARRLGVKDRTVRRWVSIRKITYVKVGAAVRISESEINRFIREGTVHRNYSPSWLETEMARVPNQSVASAS